MTLSHIPCSVILLNVQTNILVRFCLVELLFFSRSLSDLLLTIASWVCFQYLKSIKRNTFQKTMFAKYNDPHWKSYLNLFTRTIEHFDILLQIIWCPHISDFSWLEYLWRLVMHSDQWEACLSSDWPIRGQHGELLQQRASSNHRVQWPHSSAFS